MKLAPRERRQRADYLIDNAAALELGRLYLGWGRKKTSRAKTRKPAAKKAEKLSKKAAVTRAKKTAPTPAEKKKASSPGRSSTPAPTPKKTAGRQRKNLPPPLPPVTARSVGRPKKGAKAPPAPRQSVLPSAPIPAKRPQPPAHVPAPAAAVRKAAAPATKSVVQRRMRPPAPLPVLLNPVPTPALPNDESGRPDTSDMITITVRTMNGGSFNVLSTPDTILYNLKLQLLNIIMPNPPTPHTIMRVPMLVMNGRPLVPDHYDLKYYGFQRHSTVYCFPGPG